jgi:hypothetical protein
MQIINLRPLDGAGSAVARFDVELTAGATMLHWVLKRDGAGKLRAFPPSVRHIGGDGASAALSPELYHAVAAAAAETFTSTRRAMAHDRTAA